MNVKTAPKGKFRVIGQDSPADEGWRQGDYKTKEEAEAALPGGHAFIRFRVYNDRGECVHNPELQ